LVAWGVLEDSKVKGCYEQCKPMEITDPDLVILLYEAALHADKEGKAALGVLKNNPAFFPFQFPVLTGDYISQQSGTIDVVRYGLDDELLKLRQ
jgi:methyl coenzyme M reductase subunit D